MTLYPAHVAVALPVMYRKPSLPQTISSAVSVPVPPNCFCTPLFVNEKVELSLLFNAITGGSKFPHTELHAVFTVSSI